MLKEIPVVDAAMDRRLFTDTVGQAFRDIGFVFVSDPVLTSTLTPMFQDFDEFFQLPYAVKDRYTRADLFYQRGWTPPFTERHAACRGKGPDGSDLADAKENWFMGPDLPEDHPLTRRYPQIYHPNIWPTETPRLEPAMTGLYSGLMRPGRLVLQAVALGLGKPGDYFEEIIRDSPTVMRAIHYPPVRVEDVGKIVWGCQHTDINLATVLPPSTGPGLWIRRRDGVWIPGQSPSHCVIVQVGDMLEYITGGELMSAAHEVRAPQEPTEKGRLSAALFIHARSDVLLGCEGRGEHPEMYPPITAGDLLYRRLKVNGFV